MNPRRAPSLRWVRQPVFEPTAGPTERTLPIETLTDARVRSAAPPKTGILELWDGKTSGLCFRVMKSGVI